MDTTEETNAPRYQAEVYFSDFPAIDLQALATFVDETDDAEPGACIIETGSEAEVDGIRIVTFLLHVGGKHVTLLVHSTPTPAMDLLETSGMREEALETLKAHKSFALLSAFGGDEDESPSELVILLTKVAVGLCHQGALGYLLHTNGSAFEGPSLLRMIQQHEALEQMSAADASTGDMVERLIEMLGPGAKEGALGAMLEQMRAAASDANAIEDDDDDEDGYQELEDDEDEELAAEDGDESDEDDLYDDDEDEEEEEEDEEVSSLWGAIRNMGEPFPLLAAIEMLPAQTMGDGRSEGRVLITRGFAHCGFPDLMYFTPDEEEDLSPIAEMFQNAFAYMMQNGPVLEEGHTMGYDEEKLFLFSNPPASFKAPFDTYAMLMVSKEPIDG